MHSTIVPETAETSPSMSEGCRKWLPPGSPQESFTPTLLTLGSHQTAENTACNVPPSLLYAYLPFSIEIFTSPLPRSSVISETDLPTMRPSLVYAHEFEP